MKAPAHRKIIFISHDSSLTGAPILLLNLLGLLKESGQQNIRIILYRGGVLENDFKKLGRVTILKSKNYSSERSLIKRGFNFLKYRWQLILIKDEIKNAAIIFNNTIANGKLLKDLNTSDVGVITYVHELESVISSYMRDAAFTFKYSDVLVCPSHAVADNLAKNHAISIQKLFHLKYYFPFEKGGELISKEQARQQFPSSKISFSSNKFYVVAMGTATHRKGIDVFLEAAKLVKDINPDIIFVWIGDFLEETMKQNIEKEIITHQMQDHFIITGHLPHAIENLMPFDLFVLPSREDPYPLVVLEAALVNLPSVCFANTGGIQEFIGDNAGWIVPEVSAQLLANKIIEIKNDPVKLKLYGDNAWLKCIQIHTSKQNIYDQFMHVTDKAMELKKINYDH